MSVDPLLGQPLSLGDLFGSQPLLDYILARLRSLASLRLGKREPLVGEDHILFSRSEVGLGQNVSLSVHVMAISAFGENHPKVGLGQSISLLGR